MTTPTDEHVKRVGPILRGVDGELCDAVIQAIEDDNPDADVEVDDQGGYVKITTPWRCRLTRASLENELGREFRLADIEINLAGFAGRILVGDDEIVWHLEREA